MVFPIIQKILDDYKYVFMIDCKVNDSFISEHIPSFIVNKPTVYLLKTRQDLQDIIKEIFLVWRFNYHSHQEQIVRDENMNQMKKTIEKINNLEFFPYINFNIKNSIPDVNCWFKIYLMNSKFKDLLDLTYKENKAELYVEKDIMHKVITYVVYKDKNPNRLRIFVPTNNKCITQTINQTLLIVKENKNLDYYVNHFENLGLKIKYLQRFFKLINSNKSFLLTDFDFEINKDILFANVYILSFNLLSLSLENSLKYLKLNYVLGIYKTELPKKIKKTNGIDNFISFL